MFNPSGKVLINLFFFISTTEEDISNAFPELQIKNINIIKSANGNSRGFGYVQLDSPVTKYIFVFH